MSVRIEIDASELGRLSGLVSGLEAFDESSLLSVIGALGENQTRRRIEEEKTSPDGAAWPPNLEETSILLRSGKHLRDSLAWNAGGGVAEWGASWEFAHVHQYGAVIRSKDASALGFEVRGQFVAAKQVTIPAREFVGISDANASEIVEVVTDFLGSLIGQR